jgi:hypothetical protein
MLRIESTATQLLAYVSRARCECSVPQPQHMPHNSAACQDLMPDPYSYSRCKVLGDKSLTILAKLDGVGLYFNPLLLATYCLGPQLANGTKHWLIRLSFD